MYSNLKSWVLSFIALIALTSSLQAQRWNPDRLGLGKGDVAFNAEGQFSTVLDQTGPAHVTTPYSVGALVSVHAHPRSWLGAEVNGGYTSFGQNYNYLLNQGGNSIPVQSRVRTDAVELTAGYLLKVPTPWVKPFFAIGGGAVDFLPVNTTPGQWRATGMYSFGFDITVKNHPHSGFRVQEHGLFYRTPTYEHAQFDSHGWTQQSSPAIGVFVRW